MGEHLTVRNLMKKFGELKALDNFDFDLDRNEVVGLVGDNAAGKSTFLKTVYGIHKPNSGQIKILGKEATIKEPRDARDLGIEMVFQDFMLCPDLDGVQNAFLGKEKTNFGLLDKEDMRERVQSTLKEKGFEIDVDNVIQNLSGGQQQFVAVLRIFLFDPDILLLDEPTANLSRGAAETLLESLNRVREERDVGMIYVSHDLNEVISISDRIVVMRRGKDTTRLKSEEVTAPKLLDYMMGRVGKEE